MGTLYAGDRVRIISWSKNFNGMRGSVVSVFAPERVLVQLEGDVMPTLFFASEVIRAESEVISMTGAE